MKISKAPPKAQAHTSKPAATWTEQLAAKVYAKRASGKKANTGKPA